MASPELDVPLTPSADQVRRREFVTVRRGYDPEQVRGYLKQVGDQIEKLEEQVRVAKIESAAAPAQPAIDESAPQPKVDPYEGLSERMADMLRTAEKHAEDAKLEAEEERNRMLAEARSEADRIRTDSQEKAEEIRQAADDLMRRSQEDADRRLAGLNLKRDALLAELEEMRERLLSMAQSIGAVAEHDAGDSRLEGIGGAADPSPRADQLLSDPQFAELWADSDPLSDPLSDIPTLSLDDIDPDGPPAL